MGKVLLVIVGFVALLSVLFFVFSKRVENQRKAIPLGVPTSSNTTDIPLASSVAKGLDTPWALAFLPDKSILVTERPGRVRVISNKGKLDSDPIATLPQVTETGEGGLLGIAVDPNYDLNHYIYLYYTYEGKGSNVLNRISRFTYYKGALGDEKVLLQGILGNSNHNGGRIKFGPDGFLYITTGDAEEPSQAQDTKSLGGKILRITKEGKPAPGNPFGNAVYSYGHRNPQGIAWQGNTLWATEHGRSLPSGFDEVNEIEPGKNYGWPIIQGSEKKAGMVTPVVNSGENTTWAPSGAAIIGNTLYFAGLKGESLYTLNLNNPTQVVEHFKNEFGRIREVVVGPDGMLYLSTSNNDGRGIPKDGDDQIIRVNPTKL